MPVDLDAVRWQAKAIAAQGKPNFSPPETGDDLIQGLDAIAELLSGCRAWMRDHDLTDDERRELRKGLMESLQASNDLLLTLKNG